MQYGHGIYLSGNRRYEGIVTLDGKLCLKDGNGTEITATFIPLERIEFMKMHPDKIEIRVFPSVVSSYTACIVMRRKLMKKLALDVAARASMKKHLFFKRWSGTPYIR